MAPKSTAGKIAAAIYLVACVAVLAYAIAGREIRDTDIIVAYAMLLLTFPLGYLVAVVLGAIGYAVYEAFGVFAPGGLGSNAVNILIFAVVGYVQWFILLPWLYRKRRHLTTRWSGP